MASYTSNLNLKKPAGSEGYSVDDWNENMQKIDDAFKLQSTNVPAANMTGFQNPENGDIQIIHVAGRLYFVRFIMNRTLKSSAVGTGWKTLFTFPSGFTPAYDLKFEVHDDGNNTMLDARVWNNTNSFDVYSPQANTLIWGSFLYLV